RFERGPLITRPPREYLDLVLGQCCSPDQRREKNEQRPHCDLPLVSTLTIRLLAKGGCPYLTPPHRPARTSTLAAAIASRDRARATPRRVPVRTPVRRRLPSAPASDTGPPGARPPQRRPRSPACRRRTALRPAARPPRGGCGARSRDPASRR